MRRLWIQLSIAFGAVVFLSAVLLFAISITYAEGQRQVITNLLTSTVRENLFTGEQGLIAVLNTHFEAGRTVEQAAEILREFVHVQPAPQVRIQLQLITPDGSVAFGRLIADHPTESAELIGGAVLRYQILLNLPPNRPPPDQPLIFSPEGLLIMLTVVGTVLGVFGGVMMSRRIAAPLSQLAESARKMGTGDFSMRVPPRGSEEMREVAYAFNEMAARLQESEKLRSNLVADVAHELRTPLSVMEGSLRALIDDVYPMSKTEVLTLYDQTRHLSRMVNDLHELSLADAHELKFERQRIDVVILLQSIAEIFRPIAEAESMQFVVNVPSSALSVSGDAGRLRQVIQNLLVNALRHTSEGGRIGLRAIRDRETVRIDVEDNGAGIAPEHLDHIFERFYRTDRARDRASGGAGLGLAIVRAIIQAHNGTISVVSSTADGNSGTRFTIHLPALIAGANETAH